MNNESVASKTSIAPVERELMNHEMVEQALWYAKEQKRRIWHVATNRASELGHPCERRLVYLRVIPPEKRTLYSTELQYIFDMGVALEAVAKSELVEAGFKLYDPPRGKVWQKYQISGHIDTRVSWKNRIIPVEIKGVNHYLWEKIAKDPSVDTLVNDDRAWVKKMPGQLIIYMLLENVDEGFWFFKDKLTNRPKIVWLYLQPYLEYAEKLIKKAERINKHIADATLPDKYNDFAVCEDCEFNALCLPDIQYGDALEILQDDPEFIEMLDKHHALKTSSSEYGKLDRKIKERLKLIDKDKIAIGNYMIQRKLKHRDAYAVEAADYPEFKILRLGETSSND